jgi:hypothetical protein
MALKAPNMNDEAGFDYERSDIESGGIAWIGAGLATFVVAVPLVIPLTFPQSMRHISPTAPPALSTDAPVLDLTPSESLQRLSQTNADFADSYGWTDQAHGIVRIPIARAVEILLRKGIPGWPSP